jgi:cellobiose-specific phosphotransferase system component IIC
LIIFVATYLIAGVVFLVVTKLTKTEWARVFKALSIGMLPTCGILFALLVGFIAVEIWNSSATFP